MEVNSCHCQRTYSCESPGRSPGKCIPLLGRHRETPTLSGTKFAKPYPYWHKIWAQIHTLTGTNPQKRVPFVAQLLLKSGYLVQLLARSAENSANFAQFLTFYTLPGTTTGKTIPFLAHIWCSKTLPLVAHCLKTLPFVALRLAKMAP